MINKIKKDIQRQVGKSSVLCALSGGVDSTVLGKLLSETLDKKQLHCVFVDTGLLRKNEFEDVLKQYKQMGIPVEGIKAEDEFLSNLKGIFDPEEKRKIIGKLFIEIFERFLKQHPEIHFLAQGTIYPDVAESLSSHGKVSVKSHHNVGGLPEQMKLKLVEPFKSFFKEDVRRLGAELKIPQGVLGRHPFPGPGLSVRVLGEVTKEKLELLRSCDFIFIEELKKANLYEKVWQAFSILLPISTVGVRDQSRTYEKTIVLRAVTSPDGMTAHWYAFSPEFLDGVSKRITSEVEGISRVVYDITSKPPGTIEWE